MGVDMCTLLSGTMAVSASSYLGTAGHGLGMCRVPLQGSRRDGSDGYQRVYTEALDMPSAMPMSRNRTRIRRGEPWVSFVLIRKLQEDHWLDGGAERRAARFIVAT